MLELAQASAIGFGTRRWTGAGDEERTLATALDRGCSLVDVAGRAPEHAETAVGRVLSRRLDDVAVVATTGDLDPHAIVRRVRVAASRLRRDRLDVLVLDPTRLLLADAAPDPEQAAVDQAAVEQALTAAFATCELLGDRGELGCYGVRIGAVPGGRGAAAAALGGRWPGRCAGTTGSPSCSCPAGPSPAAADRTTSCSRRTGPGCAPWARTRCRSGRAPGPPRWRPASSTCWTGSTTSSSTRRTPSRCGRCRRCCRCDSAAA